MTTERVLSPAHLKLLKRMRQALDRLSTVPGLPEWEYFSLRAAYMELDAVIRQDHHGLTHAENCLTRARQDDQPWTLAGAAKILYGRHDAT